ncbi:MAG TPA: methyltransferase type 12, partial [Rhodospirillaceae bacterium]|nr:methyltransferase type 12 [Rhodospirillaceae bacterium]
FDMVYCFLSPVPMERLYAKAKDEMQPGCLFVSNSFAVPGVEPDEVVTVDDRRRTRLLVYRL